MLLLTLQTDILFKPSRLHSMNEFTFHQCNFVNAPCPPPEENPIRHLLPPEPPFVKEYRRENHQSLSFSEGNNSREYVDITLGNSPEFPSGSEPQRVVKNISYFNKKMGESINRNINLGPGEAVVEVKVIPALRESPSRSFDSSRQTKGTYFIERQQLFPSAMTESKTSRSRQKDSRIQRSGVSTQRHKESFSYRNCYKCSPPKEEKERTTTCQLKNCPHCNPNPHLHPKELSSIRQGFKCNPKDLGSKQVSSIKSKFTKTPREKEIAYEVKILTEKMTELKTRMNQLQTTNRNLSTLLQTNKQKQKAKEAEITSLKGKNHQLGLIIDDLNIHKQHSVSMQQQIHKLMSINQSLHIETEQLKKKVIYHEEKNSESLRLLQKLNDNISKKEQILQKELSEQVLISNQCVQAKNRMEIELSHALDRVKQIQDINITNESIIEAQKVEMLRLKQIINNNKQPVLEALIEELRRQIKALEADAKQSESRYIVALNQLRSKQEQYNNLQIHAEQLRKERSQYFLRHEQEKTRIFGNYDQTIRELKITVTEKDQQIERLIYSNQELQMKWNILNQEFENVSEELRETKEEKRIIIREKEEIKSDCQQLITKNQKLFKDLETAKEKELELNAIISNYQRDIIQIEETIGQSINDINQRDSQIRKWRDLYELEKSKSEKLSQEVQEKLKIIFNLEEILKKEAKVVLLYKEGLTRLQEKKEVEWNNMNKVYIEQIKRLQETVKELMQYNQNKRIQKFTVYKTIPYEKKQGQETSFTDKERIGSYAESQLTNESGIPRTSSREFTTLIQRRDLPTIIEINEGLSQARGISMTKFTSYTNV